MRFSVSWGVGSWELTVFLKQARMCADRLVEHVLPMLPRDHLADALEERRRRAIRPDDRPVAFGGGRAGGAHEGASKSRICSACFRGTTNEVHRIGPSEGLIVHVRICRHGTADSIRERGRWGSLKITVSPVPPLQAVQTVNAKEGEWSAILVADASRRQSTETRRPRPSTHRIRGWRHVLRWEPRSSCGIGWIRSG
jgi:hypothetical protein